MKVAIFVEGDVALNELAHAFGSIGYHLRSDASGRLVAEPIPSFLRRESDKSNVLRLPARPRKARP